MPVIKPETAVRRQEREREITLDPAQLNGDGAWNSRLRQPGGPP